MPMGTPDDDFFLFQGTLGELTTTLINPYSNEHVSVHDFYNINITSYHGMGGNDVISFTNVGDALFIRDTSNNQVVFSVETFLAGDGGDIIVLADATIQYNDITILGGQGNDILWGNVGNDFISGDAGDDKIDGGPGNDQLYGWIGNDAINGGAGDDVVYGEDGNDILYGGNDVPPTVHDKTFNDTVTFPHLMEGVNIVNLVPPGTNALGFADGNMTVNFQASATLTFRDGFAGYNNTLGVYAIKQDGTIEAAKILWGNTKTAGLDVAHEIDLPVGMNGGSFGFFIIADGDNVNNHYNGLNLTANGNLRFVYDYGLVTERDAKITDSGSHVKIVYDDGVTERVINGPHYHTTERGESTAINADGQTHMVSGLVDIGEQDVLRIGFEDLPNLGDADFEDVFFDFNVTEVIIQGDTENGNDILVGGQGDDTIYGQDGNDIMLIGEGDDEVYGGNGLDQFVYTFMDGLIDNLHDFQTGNGGDILNITDILQGYDPLHDALSDFVKFVSLNGDTHVSVNADGDHGGVFTQIAVMSGVDTTLANMINNGNLVANQSVVI